MKKFILVIIATFISLQTQANLLTVEIADNTYQVGDTVSADIVLSDIESEFGFQRLLANFELLVDYSSDQLGVSSIVFGDKLDVDPIFASLQTTDTTTLGQMTISELSLAFSDDLFFAQAGLSNFVLATIEFTASASGVANVDIASSLLGDDFGGAFSPATTQGASISIADTTQVPEPSIYLLMLLPVAFLMRRKFSKH